MNLQSIGRLIAENRKAKGLTLRETAASAGVGRSTLAALEGGKLPELGYSKVSRLCAAVDLVLEARPPVLAQPLLAHRHISEIAGRELTKAAIEDVIARGGLPAWRNLVKTVRDDKRGRLRGRVREVVTAMGKEDSKARAFAALLPDLLRERESGKGHG